MKFFLLINIKMPTIVGILIFISRKNFILTELSMKKVLYLGAQDSLFSPLTRLLQLEMCERIVKGHKTKNIEFSK